MVALLDALNFLGDHTRGALAGQFGTRVTPRGLMNAYGLDPGDGLGGFLADTAVGVATDPLTYLLPAAAGKAVGAATRAFYPGVKNLLQARRGFTMVKDLTPKVQFGKLGWAGRPVGGLGEGSAALTQRAGQINNGIDELVQNVGKGMNGGYDAATRTGVVLSDAPAGVGKHEIFHGLAHMGRQGATGLPLPLRLTNALTQSQNPLLKASGMLGEEALAHHVGGQGAWKFLTQPKQGYVDWLSEVSPLVGQAYGSGLLPWAGLGVAGGAGLGGLALGGRALLNGGQ